MISQESISRIGDLFLFSMFPIKLLLLVKQIEFKNVIGYLIHDNQKGFLQGRFIGENTHVIYDVIHRTLKKTYPWYLLLIDFEKAFDSFSWKFMYKVLEFFTFGPDLIKWV